MLTTSACSKDIDRLTPAKSKVLAALKAQMPTPPWSPRSCRSRRTARTAETSARFSKQSDGWRTSNRYRQMPIPVSEGGQADIQIGALEYIAAS
jgi:hypothetical protein